MIFNRIDDFLSEKGIDLTDKRVIAGFSGGPDSMLLIQYLIYSAKKRNTLFKAVHLNHSERDDADDEERFVKDFCEKRGILCSFYKEDLYSHPDIKSKGFEMCARERRLSLFEREAELFSADYIMTGHNRDDRIETFFINAARGSGIRGLSSMRAANGRYIKPLLSLGKDEISSYLKEKGIEFITDSTNSSDSFRRNRLRQVLSEREDVLFENGRGSFERTVDMLEEADTLLAFLAEKIKNEIFRSEKGEWVLDISRIINYNNILFKGIINYCLQDLCNADEAFISELVKMLRSPKANVVKQRRGYIFRKEYNRLIINETRRVEEHEQEETSLILDSLTPVHFGGYVIRAESGVFKMNKCIEGQCEAFSPEAGREFKVRSRRNGDRFAPFGRSSEIKLKDYLIERKIPQYKRSLLPLITDSSGRIICIAGLKRSSLCKAEENKECIYIYAEKDKGTDKQ